MIDFPNNPQVGDAFTSGGTIFRCVQVAPVVWTATPVAAPIPDAPTDGKLYGRKSADWFVVDKAAVGLGNADNTSDANKPISTATAAALAGKEPSIVIGTTAQYWRGDKTWQALTPAAAGLSNVTNNKQVINKSATNTIQIGWSVSSMVAQVDGSDFGNTWPINITGNSSYASNAGAVNGISGWNYSNRGKQPVYLWVTDGSAQDQYLTAPGNITVENANNVGASRGAPDRSAAWGFASGNYNLPYMRLDASGNIRYLVWNSGNDTTVQGLRQVGNPGYMEVSGANGAFSTPLAASDIRLKGNIAPSTVDASEVVRQMELIEFDWIRNGTGHIELGFNAQNLQGLQPRLVSAVEQPPGSPMEDLGAVLNLDTAVIVVYLAKALQEALARIDRLEHPSEH